MRFECDATLELSAAVDAALLRKAMEDAKPLLLKGAPSPQEGCEIKDWGATDASLHVRLSSGRYVRAHSGLVRLRNHLNATLGKAAKAGVRSVRIEQYEITGIELERAPTKPIKIHFFVDDLRVEGSVASLKISNALPIELVEAGAIDRIVELLKDKAEKQHYEGKEEIKECFWTSAAREMRYAGDPAADMEKLRWIKRTHAKGQFVYGKNFTALASAFKDILREYLYEPLGFSEMIFPKFEPWDVPSRSGHAKSIYPEAYFVCVPRVSSPAEWEPEMDYFRITGEVLRDSVLKKSVSAGIMSYAQCPPF
jgi:seryl-tRNA synthetase